jgi:phage/plasmid-like protein (TIGR03299 family)
MSANIARGMYVRIPAWHQEGTTIQFDPNTYEAQIIAGLNWTVEKKRLGFTDNFGVFHETDSYGLVRDKDSAFYGICKDKYQIFNNSEAFNWCQPLVESGLFKWESAGALRDGRNCWILLNSGEREIIKGDKLKNYLLMNWSHDGQRSIVIQPTSIRVVCENTLSAALSNKEEAKNRVRIAHFITMKPKLEEVRAMYENAEAMFEIQQKKYEKMINTVLSESQKNDFINEVCNIMYADMSLQNGVKQLSEKARKHVESVREKFKVNLRDMIAEKASGQTELGIQNTLYGAFNATSEYIEHYMTQRGQKDGYSVLFGDRGKQIREVEDLCNSWATGLDKFVPVLATA